MAITLADIIYSIVLSLPAIATTLNILILREIFREKRETGVALIEIRNELRNAAQRSNGQFRLVKENIRDLQAEMQDNHEMLINILG